MDNKSKKPLSDIQIRKMKIGNYPNMSLAEARVKVQELKNDRNRGISPADVKKEIQKQEKI